MRRPAYRYYLAASFLFAAVNYPWIWRYGNAPSFSSAPFSDGRTGRRRRRRRSRSRSRSEGGRDDREDARRLFGVAPLPSEHRGGDGDDDDSSLAHPPGDRQRAMQDDDRVASTDESDSKVNVYHHRPKQNRTGTAWSGWPKPSDRNERWWRNSKMCFDVDRICHARRTNEWFYYGPKTTASSSSKGRSEPPHRDSFQPSMELRCEPLRYDRGLIAEERVHITVDASSGLHRAIYMDDRTLRYSPPDQPDTTCQISHIPTHMVLQSMFNFMIGEFYARTLLPLHRLMTFPLHDKVAEGASTGSPPRPPWERDIQFYVHTMHGDRELLEGHKLLLSGMLSRENSGEVLSMVDLFSSDRDGEGPAEDDENDRVDVAAGAETNRVEGVEREKDATISGDCECFEQMVFCGYDVYVNEDDQGASENVPSRDVDENDVEDDGVPINQTLKEETPSADARYTLWGSSTTADDIEGTGYCGKSDIAQDLYSCEDWARLRRFLASNYRNHYPSLESDVVQFRREILLGMNFIRDNYSGNTNEWKFVGLAQRSYRRSWINLPEIMKECNALYPTENQKRVVCIEVNVENISSPYEQLLLHRSVDALIGVHGAQLTQAVLLPPHGHVLELLPWVTDYIRGWWVQTRHTPTPLGIIFHNSDLNHVGYSLGRDSVPLCKDVGEIGSQEEKECFLKGGNRKAFIWESRDFTVKPDVVLQYIENFLLRMQDDPLECNQLENALDGQFVLYNVWCATKGSADDKISPLDPKLTLRHYYDKIPDLLRRKDKKKKKKKKDKNK